jgi:hypothetical protein
VNYYTIKASLTKEQAASVSINLIPIKGKFKILTSRYGKAPTEQDNDISSTNNQLDINYENYVQKEEHIIAVMLNQ